MGIYRNMRGSIWNCTYVHTEPAEASTGKYEERQCKGRTDRGRGALRRAMAESAEDALLKEFFADVSEVERDNEVLRFFCPHPFDR